MNLFEAFILGIIQGTTEFFPVSSSGHLILTQIFLGFKNLERYILFDMICHLGTLLAIILVFYRQLYESLFIHRRQIVQVFVAILPLFPIVLFIKPLKETFNAPQYLFFFFALTALLLYLGLRLGDDREETFYKSRYWFDALVVGVFQAFAIFPGVSRSGSTIAAARLLGWSREKAVVFSFLVAIPTILGGSAIELYRIGGSYAPHLDAKVGVEAYLVAFLTSFFVGYGALRLLVRLVFKDNLMIFVWYCGALSLFCFVMFNLLPFFQTYRLSP